MSFALDFLILALTSIGFGFLSVSMERHAKQAFGVAPIEQTRRLRVVIGWLALILALIPAIYAYGLSIGVSAWVGFLAVAATLVALLLAYRPHALRPAFYVAVAGALVATLSAFQPPSIG